MRDPDRLRDIEAIRSTYRRYATEGRSRLWDAANPGYARMIRDRETALVELIRLSVPASGGRVLDLGAGDGRLADAVARSGIPIGRWVGIDLDGAAMAAASKAIRWAEFFEASADQLPFEGAAFDVVVASTLFSSLPSAELEAAVAAEVRRVLVPGGWLVWYDLRRNNPTNAAVHGLSSEAVRHLFSGWDAALRSATLLPPVARRLGVATRIVYPLLESVPFMRSHLVGRLRSPNSPPVDW